MAEMDGVALQDRIDTKYVLHVDHLYPALASLTEHYRILEIDVVRLHRYQTSTSTPPTSHCIGSDGDGGPGGPLPAGTRGPGPGGPPSEATTTATR